MYKIKSLQMDASDRTVFQPLGRAARTLAPLAIVLGLSACAVPPAPTATGSSSPSSATPTTDPAVVGELRAGSGYLFGYLLDGLPALLARTAVPNSLALLPPPPAPDSPAQAADEAARQALRALRTTPRFELARQDANLKFPESTAAFSCAIGVPITQEQTPQLAMLMRRTLTDAGLATYAAKDHYKRTRPFMAAKDSTCTPEEEGTLARDGSYPSGHASIGWAWGLVLAEVAPERAQPILQRGLAYGHSRAVCGVHWLSDIAAGQSVAAATVARLHSKPEFMAQLTAAKAEVAAARAKGLTPTRDCAAEAAALALDKPKPATAQ